MGEAFLDYKKGGSSGLDINGLIEDYYVYAGESVNAGDFVEFINGIASQTKEISEDTSILAIDYYGCVLSAVKLSDNRVFIAHGKTEALSSSSHLRGIVCAINGVTITYGADTLLTSSNTWNAGFTIETVVLENGNVFIAYDYGSDHYVYGALCSVEGTTITRITQKKIGSKVNTSDEITITYLGDNRVFLLSSRKGSVCTIGDSSITAGTEVNIASNLGMTYANDSVLLPDGNVFCAYSKQGQSLYGMVVKINGTTVSEGTNTEIHSAAANIARKMAIVLLENNRVFIAYNSTNSYSLLARVCSISGTAITPGTSVSLESGYAGYRISAVKLDNEKVFIAHSSTNNFYLKARICTVTDLTITDGGSISIDDSTKNAGLTIGSALLENGTIFVAHSYGETSYLHARVLGVNETTPTTNVAISIYETQVRPATSLPCGGVAITNGEGGTETLHKDMVGVYTNNV